MSGSPRQHRRRPDVKTARRYFVATVGAAVTVVTVVLHSRLGRNDIEAIAPNGAGFLLMGLAHAGYSRARDRKAAATARVAATGLAGTATITALEQTGTLSTTTRDAGSL
jgi:hypothetical protein